MQTDSVAVGLRLVELIALLLPAIAILLQVLVRRLFEDDESPFTDFVSIVGIVSVGLSIYFLLKVATDVLNQLTARVGNAWIGGALSELSIAVAFLAIGLTFLSWRFFLTGRPDDDSTEESTSEDDERPYGIE